MDNEMEVRGTHLENGTGNNLDKLKHISLSSGTE